MWLYGSGFPKSMALDKALESKLTTGSGNKTQFRTLQGELVDRGDYGYSKMNHDQGNRPADYNLIEDKRLDKLEPTTELAKTYSGWGTALKPSFEPIIVARKPFKGSLVDNVIEWGVGGINIDECRVEFSENEPDNRVGKQDIQKGAMKNPWGAKSDYDNTTYKPNGRFPANTILTYDQITFDEVCGGFPYTKGEIGRAGRKNGGNYNASSYKVGVVTDYGLKDSGSASRYFYCAKASKKDRDEGLDEFETKSHEEINNRKEGSAGATRQYGGGTNPFLSVSCPRKNTHPTVKPTELMQYLVRLVTPNGGTILDPFMGSGSTGKAAAYENLERNADYKFIGIEQNKEYCEIAKARINYVVLKEGE